MVPQSYFVSHLFLSSQSMPSIGKVRFSESARPSHNSCPMHALRRELRIKAKDSQKCPQEAQDPQTREQQVLQGVSRILGLDKRLVAGRTAILVHPTLLQEREHQRVRHCQAVEKVWIKLSLSMRKSTETSFKGAILPLIHFYCTEC
jgi:hypothetical protein